MRLDVDCVYRAVHLRRVLGAHEWPCALMLAANLPCGAQHKRREESQAGASRSSSYCSVGVCSKCTRPASLIDESSSSALQPSCSAQRAIAESISMSLADVTDALGSIGALLSIQALARLGFRGEPVLDLAARLKAAPLGAVVSGFRYPALQLLRCRTRHRARFGWRPRFVTSRFHGPPPCDDGASRAL